MTTLKEVLGENPMDYLSIERREPYATVAETVGLENYFVLDFPDVRATSGSWWSIAGDNQITLPEGSYLCNFVIAGDDTGLYGMGLKNVTDTEIIFGSPAGLCDDGPASSGSQVSGSYYFTASKSTIFEFHMVSFDTNGKIGRNAGRADLEEVRYTVSIIKVR